MQGVVTYPGLGHNFGCTFSFEAWGVKESAALVQVAPSAVIPVETGTLRLAYGNVVIQFPGCRIDNANLRNTGGQRVSLRILDRRWKWRFGAIFGRYNNPDRAGDNKSTRELAEICLRAMGESGYSLAELPDYSPGPEVEWIAANPADELDKLCRQAGCVIVLGLDNRVRIRRVTSGQPLPATAAVTSLGFGIDPQERPDSLLLVGAETLHQSRWELEAVGREPATGEVRPINSLSYRPSAGWEKESPRGMWNVLDQHGEKARAAALETVFRWYRIRSRVDDTGSPAAAIGPIDVLPIFPHKLERLANNEPAPAEVLGTYWNGRDSFQNTAALTLYDGQFAIDAETGIVQFREPVFKLASPGAASDNPPADLYLETSYRIRGADFAFDRYTRTKNLPGPRNGTGPHVIRRDGIREEHKAIYAASGAFQRRQSNTSVVNGDADKALDAAANAFLTAEQTEVEYAGLLPIEPDGVIRSITWTVGRETKTRAVRGVEGRMPE